MLEIPERMNAADIFVDRNVREGRGDTVAVIDTADGREYTYAQVQAMVNRVGNALGEMLDTRPEERVLCLLLDSPAFVASFFGAIKIGAVPIPTNTLMKPPDYEYFLNDSRACVAVVSAPLVPLVAPILGNLRSLRHLVIVGDATLDDVPVDISVHNFDVLLAEASDQLEPFELSKDDACFWLYSSGTTGFPKGAVHLQHDMLVCAENYARGVLDINENDRTFSIAKLFFAYGLGNALYFPFYVGATTILYPGKPDPHTYYQIATDYKPTLFFGVPTAYAALLALSDEETAKYDLSSVRYGVSAGEALPPALFERWKERWGSEILDGIGSTEILHIFISNRGGAIRPGASGTLVPGYEARIVDEAGNGVPQGEVGDLLISGDSICAAYWNKHEKTKDTIIGHWIRTGDKYLQDEDGYFHYQGRSDDMLKAGGIWVSPVEVENTLMSHPAVLECGVVGAPDAEGLVKPKAYVVLRAGYDGTDALQEELIGYVKERIAVYKYPRWIIFVDQLPKTATGKIQRYKLRDLG